jgi:anti-anti-sigma factor
METMMQTEQRNDVLVIRPKQDIVASQLDDFRKQLQSLIDDGRVNLAIDLADVGIIDSKGLAAFMMCHKSVSARGGHLTVLTTNENFKHLFHVMRLDEQFTVAETL